MQKMEPPDQFHLIAHRGGLYYRPQNSMAAFEFILNRGIEWIETDIRLSSDGVPVLFHDERIHVPGAGLHQVRELSCSELQSIDIGGGELLPTLGELFDRFSDRFYYDFDIKDPDAVDVVVPIIRRYELAERSVLSSFIPDALQRALEIAPEIHRGLLLDNLTGRLVDGRHAVNAARLLECEYFLPHHRILKPEWVETAGSEGLKVIAWTVNQLADAQRMLNMGVDGLISDRPDYLRGLVKEDRVA
ncbi:MAG TPA: glycerophosphodiester phosphodiesterase [Bacteroidetes bacterium]|nr:glycerophosphodiester phosphodiesterase [Bacteroidota bacterium]